MRGGWEVKISMIYKNLYIIGNGFDLHHGIKCGFTDFMKWVEKNDESLFADLTDVYNYDDKEKWWKDFENSLAKLNISYYANKIGNQYDPEYIQEGSIEERTEYASQKVIEEFDRIKASLRRDFHKWLSEAYENCPKYKKVQFPNKDSVFLTFNYTKTLEDLYEIDARQVCHIHGVIDDEDSMVVGHGMGIEGLKDMLESQKPRAGEIFDKRLHINTKLNIATPEHTELATDSTLDSMISLKKDVEECIERKKRFFNDILDVQTIYVYGFSFSSIDMPYIEKIVRRTKSDAHWVFSWHSPDDEIRIMDFVIRYNIQNFSMIKGIKNLDIQV